MLSQQFSPRKVADSSMMDNPYHTALAFSMMQGQKSLTLHGRSFLGYSSDVVVTMIAEKGCQ